MMLKNLKNVDNKWFFKNLHPFFKVFLIFVRGDLIVFAPFILLLLVIALFSLKFALLMTGTYIAVRNFGEMIYWFSHQFNLRKYRPYDFGFKYLDNHAIYILYQTFAIVGTVFGIGLVFWTLLYVT